MSNTLNEPETIHTILEKTKTIAVLGLSDNPDRPAFHVSKYMQQAGYRIIPVHPGATKALGETAYPTLDAAYAAEGRIDLVDVFRASQYVPEIVKDVMRLKIPYGCRRAFVTRKRSNGRKPTASWWSWTVAFIRNMPAWLTA